MKKALIFFGGWDGHNPTGFAELFESMLTENGYEVESYDNLDCLNDAEKLLTYDVIIPFWTMGQIEKEQFNNLSTAIQSGVGLAGVHGGMGDAFRGNVSFQWMVGGQFLGHPHVGPYKVDIIDMNHPIVRNIESFDYDSEQYYMQVDPSIEILAETQYNHEGKTVTMPVVWTKNWGNGKVFYSALGHDIKEYIEQFPVAAEIALRGFIWATR